MSGNLINDVPVDSNDEYEGLVNAFYEPRLLKCIRGGENRLR